MLELVLVVSGCAAFGGRPKFSAIAAFGEGNPGVPSSAKEKLVGASAVVVLTAVLALTVLEPSVEPESKEVLPEEKADQVLEEIMHPSPCHQYHGRHKLVASESPRCLNPYSTVVVPSSPCLLQVQGIERK